MLALFMALLFGVCTAMAQKQEIKLIDRLLRPNTTLENSAQNKKFAAPDDASFDKRVPPRNFYVQERTLTKPYPAERTLPSRQFTARHFRMGDSAANLATRTQLTKNDTTITPPAAPGIRAAPESTVTAATGDFPGARPFLGRGKSQKALQAYNRPLTIDEVRELLNKSK